MSEVKFSKEHEWITVADDIATIGITKHAAELLGDIVFVELPDKGLNVEKDKRSYKGFQYRNFLNQLHDV